ncbi:MAG: hypothetical protein ABIM44_08405 [candidate division WOR-3 bacterium]
MVDKSLILVTLNIRQFDNSNNLIYSGSIPVGVEEHETFSDLLRRMIESSEIKSEIKQDLKSCLSNQSGHRGFVFYVVSENGERVVVNLRDKVAEVSRHHGTSQIGMDIFPIVGSQ